MRKMKQIFSFVIVLALLMSLSTGAFAASYTVSSLEELKTAFADESGEDVDIDLTANVSGGSTKLTAKDGIKYTISTKNDSVLNEVRLYGSGEVEINTDITYALYDFESVTVTVNGDIRANTYAGVFADSNSTVTVNGDIRATNRGVHAAGNSTVTVNGNITSAEWGVQAEGSGTVTVNGNITAEDNNGVGAFESSKVTVTGNISGGERGVQAEGNSTVTVNGDVTGDCGISAREYSAVTVNGNVAGRDGDPSDVNYTNPENGSDGGEGIHSYGYSTVNVTGNVTGGKGYGHWGFGGDGILASGCSNVTVGGSVTGGDVYAEPLDSNVHSSRAGSGIYVVSSATVWVGGNATGGSTNRTYGEGGHGVDMKMVNDEPGSLYVGGNVTGGSGGDKGVDGAGLRVTKYHGEEAVPEMYFGTLESIEIEEIESLTSEQLQHLLDRIHIMGLKGEEDLFWLNVYMEICRTEKGGTVTVDAKHYTTVPVYVLRAAYEHEVTLVIEWDGGEAITVSGYDCESDSALIELAELAKLINK